MNNIQRIIANVGVLSISQLINSILGILLLMYLARYLGVDQYGKYNFALSFCALFMIFAGLGIDNYLIRDLARDKELVGKYFINALITKLVLSFFSFILIAVFINIMEYPKDTIYIIYLFAIYSLLNTFYQTFSAIFQSFERMEFDAVLLIIYQSSLFASVMVAGFLGFDLIRLSYLYILASLLRIAIGFIFVSLKFTKLQHKLSLSLCKRIVLGSIPFGLNALFALLFFQIGTVMLSFFSNDAAVGIYSAGYNPLLALSVIPYVFVTAIYPVMSRYFTSSDESLELILELSCKYIAILGLPTAVGCFILADRFINIFYGNSYQPSELVFQLLVCLIPLRWVSNITGTFLTSTNRQTRRTVCVGISATFNIILNLALIPRLGYVGAGVTTISSEAILYVLFIYFINKDCKIISYYTHYLKPAIASIIMGVSIFIIKDFSLPLIILIGSVIYFSCLVIFNTFDQVEKDLIGQIVGGTKDMAKSIKNPIIKDNLCSGCGTCIAFCPNDALELTLDERKAVYIPLKNEEKCNECGVCHRICPGDSDNLDELNSKIFGEKLHDEALGTHQNCYITYSNDHDIRYNSSSGGLITQVLIYALEEGIIDGALVTRMKRDRPLEPEPFIARTKEEIIEASRSKYCPVPLNIALKELINSKEGKAFAVVGLPCHIQGIRKAEELNKGLKEKIVLHLGIFCNHSPNFLGTRLFLKSLKIDEEDVLDIDYRGKGWPGFMTITLRSEKQISIPLPIYWRFVGCSLFFSHKCLTCSDGSCELADISFGDAWLPEVSNDKVGTSIIISRNRRGELLLEKAKERAVIELKRVDSIKVIQSQAGMLYIKKKIVKSCDKSNPRYTLNLDRLLAAFIYFNSCLPFMPVLGKALPYIPAGVLYLYFLPFNMILAIKSKRYLGYMKFKGGSTDQDLAHLIVDG